MNEKFIEFIKKQEKLNAIESDLMMIENMSEFNEQLTIMADANPIEKQILIKVGKSKGFIFNKDKKIFEVAA